MPENMEKKTITSTVVMSKSFREERDKRDQSREQRERQFRSRRTSNSDDEALGNRRRQRQSRDSPDRAGNRERNRLSDRSSRHVREKDEERSDRDKRRDRGNRQEGRNMESERPDSWRGGAGRRDRGSNFASGQERRSVFDRLDHLDQGPRRNRPMGRGQVPENFRDDRMVEVEVNPQDVPRGKRYFMHDDREMPRRQMGRARSRSPIWSHDMWEEVLQEDEPEETKEASVKEEKHDRKHEGGEDTEQGRPREEKRSRRVFR